jgi:predicted O-methyltransferase YrrM
MPKHPTYLNDELYEYCVSNFSCEDEYLINLKKKADDAGIPHIYITPEQGLYMQFLVKSINAKNIIEVGTLAGYSAIVMARAMPEDGKLITIEKNEQFAEFAKEMIKNSDVAHKIEVITANAKTFLKNNDEFNEQYKEKFDLAFVDANKPFYQFYLDHITGLLRKKGIYIADNAFAFGFLLEAIPERNPNKVKSMLSFNNYFKNKEEYFVSLVPIGDGMIMGIKE